MIRILVVVSLGMAMLAGIASAEKGKADPESLTLIPEEASAVRQVRIDLEHFLRTRIDSASASIEMPPLSLFNVSPQGQDASYHTELSTRASTPLRGRVPVTVALYDGDHLVKRTVVSPYIRETARAVVASHDLKRGEILAAGDLKVMEVDQARMPGDAIVDLAQVIGYRMKRSVRRDRVVRENAVESVPLVERGERVTLILESGRLRVQSIGRAREAGAIGEWIRVQNLDSKREVSGRVGPEGRVHVSF